MGSGWLVKPDMLNHLPGPEELVMHAYSPLHRQEALQVILEWDTATCLNVSQQIC
jgi:hypothetical protein